MEHSLTGARLGAAGFQVISAVRLPRHALIARERFAALVEKNAAGYGRAGSTGLLTEHGFATLIWRGSQAYFVARGFERSATPEEVGLLRAFASDLEAALTSGT